MTDFAAARKPARRAAVGRGRRRVRSGLADHPRAQRIRRRRRWRDRCPTEVAEKTQAPPAGHARRHGLGRAAAAGAPGDRLRPRPGRPPAGHRGRQPDRHHGDQRRARQRHERACRRDRRFAHRRALSSRLRGGAGGAGGGRAGRAATARACLRAVALGYDVGARFVMALGLSRAYGRPHSTHSLGGLFGAAAAAGALLGLDARQLRFQLSYVVQQASGLAYWMRDPDHIEKAFDFGGMPARNARRRGDHGGGGLHRGRGPARRTPHLPRGVRRGAAARGPGRRPRQPVRDHAGVDQEVARGRADPGRARCPREP